MIMLKAFLKDATIPEWRQIDWSTLLIAADWLEEQGEALKAEGLRWLVENRREPKLFSKKYADHYDSVIWAWHLGPRNLSDLRAHVIPSEIFGETRFKRLWWAARWEAYYYAIRLYSHTITSSADRPPRP